MIEENPADKILSGYGCQAHCAAGASDTRILKILRKKGEENDMRILIAEDEVELARGLKFLLEKSKFSVDVVHNGLDALDYFHGAVYDAVVLDIMMPKMSGLDVLVRLREEGASVPVMMLTAKAEIEDRVAGLEAGLPAKALCQSGVCGKGQGSGAQKCGVQRQRPVLWRGTA